MVASIFHILIAEKIQENSEENALQNPWYFEMSLLF